MCHHARRYFCCGTPMPLASLLLHFLFGMLSDSHIHALMILIARSHLAPDLTWRDIQHLSVLTAEVVNAEDPDWDKTAAGRPFSYKYGYGRLNGYEFVTAAQNGSS